MSQAQYGRDDLDISCADNTICNCPDDHRHFRCRCHCHQARHVLTLQSVRLSSLQPQPQTTTTLLPLLLPVNPKPQLTQTIRSKAFHPINSLSPYSLHNSLPVCQTEQSTTPNHRVQIYSSLSSFPLTYSPNTPNHQTTKSKASHHTQPTLEPNQHTNPLTYNVRRRTIHERGS
jgi:hypothetical protein